MSSQYRAKVVAVGAAMLAFVAVAVPAHASMSAAQAKGAPIKIMQWAPDEKIGAGLELYQTADATVKAINAAGGIPVKGGPNRPLQLLKCVIPLAGSPLASNRCARAAIDNNVAAITGKYPGDDNAMRAVTGAGIPVVVAFPVSGTQDTTNKLAFPLSGGGTGLAAALGAALQQAGGPKVQLALADSPNARNFPPLTARLLKNGGSDLLPTVYFPLDPSADVTTYASQIVNRQPDGVAIVHSADGTIRMIRALREAGYRKPIAVSASFIAPSDIKQLGPLAEGIVVVSNWAAATSKADKGIVEFNKLLDRYGPKVDRTELAIASWASVNAIANGLKGTGGTASELAANLQGMKINRFGAPNFTLGVPGLKTLPSGRVPRDTVQIQTIKGGKILPLKDGVWIYLDTYKP